MKGWYHIMDENKITLEFDDGGVVDCEILGLFDVKGVEYIAIAELEGDDVYLYRYVAGENEDDFEMVDIPDDEFEMVAKEFDAIMEQLEG